MDWSSRIRDYLWKERIHMNTLAFKLGVSSQTVRKWIYYGGEPSRANKFKLRTLFQQSSNHGKINKITEV